MAATTRPLRKWTVPELDGLCVELQAWFAAHDGEPHVTERYLTILQFIDALAGKTPEWYGTESTAEVIARIQRAIEAVNA